MDDSVSSPSLPDSPWNLSVGEATERLDVDPEQGLTEQQVDRRRDRWGLNRLQEVPPRSLTAILVDQFRSLIVLLLVLAAAVAFGVGEWIEGAAVMVVIVLNAGIGFVTEWRAVRSMEALRELAGLQATVRREGELREIPAEQLVPGDVVVVEGGSLVTADVRLTEASKMQADESALTGESTPVDKAIEPTDREAPLAERSSMLYKGSTLTRGAGEGVVVRTGMETELGEISELVRTAEEEETPLEERLDALGNRLIGLTLVIALFVILAGVAGGRDLFLMVETGLALAVAAVPEGLPVVATMALARGMWRMARRNVLVNRLSSVETLGSTTVIFTDKTGTLTENEMTVHEVRTDAGSVGWGEGPEDLEDGALRELITTGVLCNNSALADRGGENGGARVGDPLEVALLQAGRDVGLEREGLLEQMPEVREEAFDTETKMMATFHRVDGGVRVAVKGAPENVLEHSTHILTPEGEKPLDDAERRRWLDSNSEMTEDGLRVLGLARRTDAGEGEKPYENLVFLGLVGLLDPPRRDVASSLRRCGEAGIEVVMVTGDHGGTARKVAREVGLVDDPKAEVVEGRELEEEDGAEDRWTRSRIFARVTPRQKLKLIEVRQRAGDVTAMTGDGVNDAPALKKADIGVAMGRRGTQVARDAADMVLQDDAFSSIVAAVEQGRVIFKNIRKFVFYLLSCNVSEILVVGLASVAGVPLPILPLQILFLNLVTDVFPALALGFGEGDERIMQENPREPEEPILRSDHWMAIGVYGLVFAASVLGSLMLALDGLGFPVNKAVTVSFLTLASAQLFHVFNMRSYGSGPLDNDVVRNPYVWGALGLCAGLLAAAVYVPILARVMKITPPGVRGWLLVLSMSLVPLVYGQLVKATGLDPFRGGSS